MNRIIEPVFVITGPPNKGKSSLVSALANDDRVEIGPIAGTTVESQDYQYKIDGELMFTIWDTPGFENPRSALSILKEMGLSESEYNRHVFEDFINAKKNEEIFKSEVEIFSCFYPKSIIVYVIDSSVPFSESRYMHEINIIKLTGLKSIAIYNPISNDTGKEEWEFFLNKHFNMVKEFNPKETSFKNKLNLLEGISHLERDWHVKVKETIRKLEEHREFIIEDAANVVSNALINIYTRKYNVNDEERKTDDEMTEILFQEIRKYVSTEIDKSQKKILKLFEFNKIPIDLNFDIDKNNILELAAFKKYLPKSTRAIIYATVGAATGAIIEGFLLGGGLGIPTLLAGAAGWTYGYYSDYNPIDIVVKARGDGSKFEATKLHAELGIIVINRLRELIVKLYNRSAANRNIIEIEFTFGKSLTKKLSKEIENLAKQKSGDNEIRLKLKNMILEVLNEYIHKLNV